MGQSFHSIPGRVITDVERGYLPSGRCCEIRHIQETGQAAVNLFVTRNLKETDPPTACGCFVERLSDFGECSISGDGTVRFLYDGKEVMRTEVPKGAVLKSVHNSGSVRIKILNVLPVKAG